MGVLGRFAARSLARNRVRTAVSAVGIALACALVTAVLTTVVSMTAALERRTAADEGSWQVEIAGITQQGYERLTSDRRIAGHADIVELGAIDLGEGNASEYGRYCFLKTMPTGSGGDSIVSMPEMVSGRVPNAPGEIMLPNFFEDVEVSAPGLSSDGTIGLGSTISLVVGERTIIESDGTTYVGTSHAPTFFGEDEGTTQQFAPTGTLDNLTVVGFYRSWGYSATMALQGNCLFIQSDGNALEQALADGSDATCAYSLATVQNPSDAYALADEFGGDAGLATLVAHTHESLLRWQGFTQDSATWNALYAIAAVLAAVIVVAGVSLVYNSFAISVAERTRQFGLLASLGASRRQLRRSVLIEALLLSAVSIPLGLVMGLVGCYAVFQFTGTGLSSMFGMDAYGATVTVQVRPAVLVVSAALALVTVLVSAWVPAVRASRVSAVDAIRQTQDVRLTRRERRASGRRVRKGADPLKLTTGISGKLFGVPGFVAHRNLSRATSKGRVTVGALAVSVALLIISGSIAEVLSYASGVAGDTAGGVDLSVSVDATSAESADGELVRANGQIDTAAFQTSLKGLYEDAEQNMDADALGYYTRFIADVMVPADLLSSGASSFFDTMLSDGSWSGPVYIDAVDDATWATYIAELGLSTDEFSDPNHPRAVLLNEYAYSSGDGTYSSYSPLAEVGAIETVTYAEVEGMYAAGVYSDEQGEPYVWYNAPNGDERRLSLDEGLATRDTLAIGALADHAPLSITSHTSTLQLILPASALPAVSNIGFGDARIDISTEGSATGAAQAQEDFDAVAKEHPELDCTYSNYAQEKAQTRMMNSTVQTFIYCFSAICGLIAVANVFNTLTNSLILRRREFAVLRSVGMGDAAFRRMIAYECVSYAVRGFVIGFVLALIVHALLFRFMINAFATYTFRLPWLHLGVAAAIALAVILVSVAYALRMCRADSVVEALRADAI